MYKLITILGSLTIVLSSCSGLSAEEQVSTSVAQTAVAAPPTETPLPTSTPLPTDTPTPLPTATLDFAATSTAQASGVVSEIGAIVGDEIAYQDGHLAWKQSEPVSIEMTGRTEVFKEIDEKLTAGDFIFKSDVTWNGAGILWCGAIFRSEANLDQGKQYRVYFRGDSGLQVYFININVDESGKFKNQVAWSKFSGGPEISNGATFQFMLVAKGEQFTLYVNGQRQGRFFDYSKQRSEGYFGFVASQDSREGSCKFENSWVWMLN
jgi:hypothetical protein